MFLKNKGGAVTSMATRTKYKFYLDEATPVVSLHYKNQLQYFHLVFGVNSKQSFFVSGSGDINQNPK